jgi:hypothetical protein
MAAIPMTFALLSGADAQISGHPAADLIQVWTKIGNAANMKQYYFCFNITEALTNSATFHRVED